VPTLGRDETIARMVAAWKADLEAWREPLLLAWRRADVDELNTTARVAWEDLGRLSGPELEAPGGRHYRFGDRVLMLTPGPNGAWVTSERATIVDVNLTDRSLTAFTPDGRVLHLDAEATGGERLTHAYALTCHRAQGATCDTAHVLENGGGRELAYVAMSRARTATHVYVPAGHLDDATEQLRWAWISERRPRWATDQGTPVAQLVREFTRLDAFVNRQTFAATAGDGARLVARRRAIETEISEVQAGTGRHAATPAGQAARELAAAQAAHHDAQRAAGNAVGPFTRRRARRDLAERQAELMAAAARYEQHVGPELARLRAELDATPTPSRTRYEERDAWLAQHPAIHQHLRDVARTIGDLNQHETAAPNLGRAYDQVLDVGL
jgi:hypothetical protein